MFLNYPFRIFGELHFSTLLGSLSKAGPPEKKKKVGFTVVSAHWRYDSWYIHKPNNSPSDVGGLLSLWKTFGDSCETYTNLALLWRPPCGPAALPAVRPDHGSTANVAVRRRRTNVGSWYPTWQLESGPSPVHTPYTQYIDGYSM